MIGWNGRVSADTANDPNPNVQIYQLPKIQRAIDPIYQGAPADEAPSNQGPPSSEHAPSDDVSTGDGEYNGDGDTTDDVPNKKRNNRPAITIPLPEIIDLLTKHQQQPTLPDLAFATSAVKFDEATRRVTLSFCVVNAGQGGSKATTVSIRDHASQVALDSPKIVALASGGKACRDGISASVPAGFTGARQYNLAVDPQQLVKESNEGNNTSLATVDIGPLIDLRIASTAARFDPATSRVMFSFCVANVSKIVSGNTEVSIRDRLTGDSIGKVAIGPLSPGGQTCRSDVAGAALAGFNGTRLYDAMVDPQDRIAESNEDNNTATAKAGISALPDLAITNATVRFDEAARQAALSFCVVNRGKVAVKQASVSIRDQVATGLIASPAMGPIAPGAQVCRKDVPAAVPAGFAGARKYNLVVDPQGRIAETDEGNNAASIVLKIQAQKPDLAFARSSVGFDQAARQATISYCVVNLGKGAAKGSDVTISDHLTGEVIANPAIGPLQAGGQTCSKDLPALIPAGFNGTRQYDLVADAKGLIAEADEDNNATSVTAEANTQPDLSFTDATAKFDEAAGELVLSFCVINRGKASSNETRVSIRDPATGTEIQSPRIALLAADQRTCRDGLLLPVASGFSGTQRYELSVDPDGKVSESDETNNAAKAEAYVSALPNLAFADSSTKFDEVTRRAMLSFCVVNRGQASSKEAALSIRNSGRVVASLTAGALSASSEACFNDVAMPALEDHAGTRSYELIVDADNATNESDENDNMRTVSVAVPELPAPADYVTAAGPADEPIDEPAHIPLAFFVVAIVGVGVLSGGIVFLLVRPRSGKRSKARVTPEAIQFRGRPDSGTQVTHSASAQIVLPRLRLRGHTDPGQQHIEMRGTEMRIAGE